MSINKHEWNDSYVDYLTNYHLRNWRHHPDFQDLLQEGCLELYQAWKRSGQKYTLPHLANLVLPHIPNHWFRTSRAGNITYYGETIFTVQPASSFVEDRNPVMFGSTGISWSDDRLTYIDFMAGLPPRDQKFAQMILEGYPVRIAGEAVGLKFTGAKDLWGRILNRYRLKIGVPQSARSQVKQTDPRVKAYHT